MGLYFRARNLSYDEPAGKDIMNKIKKFCQEHRDVVLASAATGIITVTITVIGYNMGRQAGMNEMTLTWYKLISDTDDPAKTASLVVRHQNGKMRKYPVLD